MAAELTALKGTVSGFQLLVQNEFDNITSN